MKIALLADIHANFRALESVLDHIKLWNPDRVIVAGDIVNRGPRPLDCLETILEGKISKGWQVIRGNHEDYVISQADPKMPKKGPVADVHQASAWTYTQLNHDISPLLDMPFKHDNYDPNGKLVRTVHGTMLGNRDGIYPETSNQKLILKLGIEDNLLFNLPVVFGVGHTHRPLIRWLNGILIVNAGSVGLPFDGDPRACYAQLWFDRSTWNAKIIRLDYDLQQAEDDFQHYGYTKDGGPLVQLVLIELKNAESHLYNWSSRYQAAAMRGEISMRETVERYLAEIGIPS